MKAFFSTGSMCLILSLVMLSFANDNAHNNFQVSPQSFIQESLTQESLIQESLIQESLTQEGASSNPSFNQQNFQLRWQPYVGAYVTALLPLLMPSVHISAGVDMHFSPEHSLGLRGSLGTFVYVEMAMVLAGELIYRYHTPAQDNYYVALGARAFFPWASQGNSAAPSVLGFGTALVGYESSCYDNDFPFFVELGISLPLPIWGENFSYYMPHMSVGMNYRF